MKRLTLFISGMLLTSTFVHSKPDHPLRDDFLQAERQIASLPYKQAQQELRRFADYPLFPYLQQKRLMQHLTADQQIADFLQQYQGAPMDWPLRKRWLQQLAKRGQSELYLQHYLGSNDAELECYALRFKLADKKIAAETLWPKVQKLWTVGKSQPDACDPLFGQWRAAGNMTPAVVWQRIKAAAEGGNASLIPYLKTLLPAKQQYLADLYLQTRRNPAVIARDKFFPLKHEEERDILSYGLKRLIWRQPDLALKVWQRFINDPYFSAGQRLEVKRQFAIALASKGDTRSATWFKGLPGDMVDDGLAHWQVAAALQQLDWPRVEQIITAFPSDVAKDPAWRYWLARAYGQQGKDDKARPLLEQLALERHFYGFMAAARLGLPPSLAHTPVTVSDQELEILQQHPAVKRAQEWLALGRLTEARREWNHLQDSSDEQQKLVSAKLAHKLEWYERAIFSLADVGYWDDIELRFPLAYQNEFASSSAKAEIDSAWTMAIARRESSFMADANSPVGARGLMQLMPATAREVAKKAVTAGQLYNPLINIDYGTNYLNYLMQRNDGNLLMATAAYNAGYSRVRQWVPRDYAVPADVWVETIPYRETREYVKAVMAYYQIYNIRLNVPTDVFKPLISMQIGVKLD